MQNSNDEGSKEESSNISRQAEDIRKNIKNLEKELDTIQNGCNHPDYVIKNCPTQSSTFQLKRVCTKCTKEIGYPTQEEILSWSSS
jgi:hypothetical protein